MVIVEIQSDDVKTMTIQRKKDGMLIEMRTQRAWALIGETYPREIVLSFFDNDQAYKRGLYVLSETSFFVGDFNRLSLRRPVLIPFDDYCSHLDKLLELGKAKNEHYKNVSGNEDAKAYARASGRLG